MNVKVRMPKFGKKIQSKKYWVKELLMTILATSISIVLTFGTAYLIEQHQKKKSQHRMALMIIHDIDETIQRMEKVDSIIKAFGDLQLTIFEGKYDSPIDLANIELTSMDPDEVKFAETTERIFTTNVDTWSTIGRVDFIDNVSGCYIIRAEYQEEVIDALHKRISPNEKIDFLPLDDLLQIDIDYYMTCSAVIINRLKTANELNKRIMGISDKELEKFNAKMEMVGIDQEDLDSLYEVIDDKHSRNMFKRLEAMDKYYSKKAASNKKKNNKRNKNKK